MGLILALINRLFNRLEMFTEVGRDRLKVFARDVRPHGRHENAA
jgi:hypothetical protein